MVRETTDYRDKMTIHRALEEHRRGRLSRRRLVQILAAAGVGLGMARPPMTATASPAVRALAQESQAAPEVAQYLTDVGGQFKGATIKVVSEATAPSRAINTLVQSEFTPTTGITVNWELVPLEQVLSKVSVDAAQKAGTNDIYYFDQAWVGRFINDTYDPRELMEEKADLAFPNYNMEDFLEPLVRHIASYGDKMIGFPCDVPIFIYMYRQDVYDELGLQPATTMEEYLSHTKTIFDAKQGEGIYGTVGQMKSGHYSLNCDMTAWVWSHGGSVFGADQMCSLNDEQGVQGLNYMLELQKYMPAGVTTWDWDGQAQAMQKGQGGHVITWGEIFPGLDDPATSTISGLIQPVALPANAALRPPEEAGFEETPELGHQGGSTYCLSAYSKNVDPAWVFLQWATSSDVQTRASLLGGGASPMRRSTFEDPRVKEAEKVGAGTTRHFPVMLQTIENRMGTEPHLPQWPEIANNIIAVEIGKLTTGGYANAQEAADEIKRLADETAAPARTG